MGRRPRRGSRPSHAAAVVAILVRHSSHRRSAVRPAALARGRALGSAACNRRRRAGCDLRRLVLRPVVAARRRPDQSRHGDAVACGRHRGQYRSRQYGRDRRHADRAGGPHPDRRPYPRHRRARPRPRGGGDRAQGRGQAVRRCAADGTAARRKPQPGRCRIVGAHHTRRLCHGVDRGHHQAARHRRCLEARGGCGFGPARRRPRRSVALPINPPPSAGSIRRRAACSPGSTGSTASASPVSTGRTSTRSA